MVTLPFTNIMADTITIGVRDHANLEESPQVCQLKQEQTRVQLTCPLNFRKKAATQVFHLNNYMLCMALSLTLIVHDRKNLSIPYKQTETLPTNILTVIINKYHMYFQMNKLVEV